MAWPWAYLGHTNDTQACTHGLHDMCGVHPVGATTRGMARPTSYPRWHERTWALCSEPVRKAMGTTPWFDGALDAQLTRTQDDHAWHKGTMPYALRRHSHGHNAMARCCGALIWQRELDTCPGHGHLDMAWAHTLVKGKHTDALDTWSAGWSMLLVQRALIKDTLVDTYSQKAPYGEEAAC